jgi:hypothetical protein
VGIPVDLMVPEALAGSGGTREARIPPHDKHATRRTLVCRQNAPWSRSARSGLSSASLPARCGAYRWRRQQRWCPGERVTDPSDPIGATTDTPRRAAQPLARGGGTRRSRVDCAGSGAVHHRAPSTGPAPVPLSPRTRSDHRLPDPMRRVGARSAAARAGRRVLERYRRYLLVQRGLTRERWGKTSGTAVRAGG